MQQSTRSNEQRRQGVGAIPPSASPGRSPASTPDTAEGLRVEAEGSRPAEHVRARSLIWQWVAMILLSFLTYGLINRFILSGVVIQGRSMLPAFRDGEWCVMNRWSYYTRSPQRGDVVVLRDPSADGYAVKRIVALPGEFVFLRQGLVYVNGRRLPEPYLAPGTRTFAPDSAEKLFRVTGDGFFVLGDNRAMSEDSRSFGSVPRSHIMGMLSR